MGAAIPLDTPSSPPSVLKQSPYGCEPNGIEKWLLSRSATSGCELRG